MNSLLGSELGSLAYYPAPCQYIYMKQENVPPDNGLNLGSFTAQVATQGNTSPVFRGEHSSRSLEVPYDISLARSLTEELKYTAGCVPLWELADDPGKGVKVVMWKRDVPGQIAPLLCAVMRTPDEYRTAEALPFADPDDPGPGDPGEYILSLQQPNGLIKYRYLDDVDLSGGDSLTDRAVIQIGNPETIFKPNPTRPMADGGARKLTMPGIVTEVVGYR